MANVIQFRRGTTSQHTSFTGLVGEVTVDTDKDTLVVHDGTTAGGHALLKEASIGSTVQGYDVDTTKNDVANTFTAIQTFSRALRETRVAIAASNIDLSLGNYFTRTISGTTTLTVSNVASSGTVSAFVLDLTNGGSATVNWPSGTKWAAGTPPTLTASGRDVLGFFTHDGGTTWNAFVLGKAMA